MQLCETAFWHFQCTLYFPSRDGPNTEGTKDHNILLRRHIDYGPKQRGT